MSFSQLSAMFRTDSESLDERVSPGDRRLIIPGMGTGSNGCQMTGNVAYGGSPVMILVDWYLTIRNATCTCPTSRMVVKIDGVFLWLQCISPGRIIEYTH